MERMILIFTFLSLGQAVYLRDDHAIALKLHGFHEKWLSCWMLGSDCQFRDCPDKLNNPFVRGGEFGYSCRGEIFWIHKQGGGYIKSCDYVALEYETGWWLSCPHTKNVGSICLTRPCPAEALGEKWTRCGDELFQIKAIDKECGDRISNFDIIILYIMETGKQVVSLRNSRKEANYTPATYVRVGTADKEIVSPHRDPVTPSADSYKFRLFINS